MSTGLLLRGFDVYAKAYQLLDKQDLPFRMEVTDRGDAL